MKVVFFLLCVWAIPTHATMIAEYTVKESFELANEVLLVEQTSKEAHSPNSSFVVVKKVWKSSSSLRENQDILICNDISGKFSYDFSAPNKGYSFVLFLARRGECFDPIFGRNSVVQVLKSSPPRVYTGRLMNQPETQAATRFYARLDELATGASQRRPRVGPSEPKGR
jgi:hypothetical protein